MKVIKEIFCKGLIVSCQAKENSPLRDSLIISRLAKAAQMGGAVAVRINGKEDIAAVKAIADIPVIGINKRKCKDGEIVITPDFESVVEIVEAGADVVALDATITPNYLKDELGELIKNIHNHFDIPVMADISCLEEGIFAVGAGADLISTTLSGYTPRFKFPLNEIYVPDIKLIEDLVNCNKITVPVIAEGRFWRWEDVAKAFALGVYAIVIGKAITNPTAITQYYVSKIKTVIDRGQI